MTNKFTESGTGTTQEFCLRSLKWASKPTKLDVFRRKKLPIWIVVSNQAEIVLEFCAVGLTPNEGEEFEP